MGGRIYVPPGTPASEVDPVLRRKRKANVAANNKKTARKIPKEFEYHGTPVPLEPAALARAATYVRRRGGEHAELLLEILDLDQPAPVAKPKAKRGPKPKAPVAQAS